MVKNTQKFDSFIFSFFSFPLIFGLHLTAISYIVLNDFRIIAFSFSFSFCLFFVFFILCYKAVQIKKRTQMEKEREREKKVKCNKSRSVQNSELKLKGRISFHIHMFRTWHSIHLFILNIKSFIFPLQWSCFYSSIALHVYFFFQIFIFWLSLLFSLLFLLFW